MDDKLVINIDLGEEKDLISELKSLSSNHKKKSKNFEPEEDSEPILLTSVAKKKKDGKKKKKKKELDLDLEFISSGKVGSPEEIKDDEETVFDDDNLIDIDEILNRDDDDNIEDPIIDEQKKGYEKRKKDENPFKKEFAEELTLLYSLLDEVNKFNKELEKKYKAVEGSKTRGISKWTTELINSMLSAKTSKLQILKEISNIKKTIADLKIKQDGKKANVEGEKSVDLLAAQYFQNVLKYGRSNFIKDMGSVHDDDDEIDDLVEQIEKNKMSYSSDELERIQSYIEERLETEGNPFRSEAGSKYIQYENRGVKICIKRCIDTGEWEFIAIDRDNQQVFDYPLPRKRDVGKVRFSDDGRYATDERGRTYKVIEYFSPDEE
jgi:hypothetical protein